MFTEEAKNVKEDVLLNGSACDPRFEDIIGMNRLHDIQYVYGERQLRARVSSLAAPGLLIDSDGAIMISDWVEETYLCAVLYSTPSLYYIKRFHDDVSFSDEKMKSLGMLLSLSAKKPFGSIFYESYGNWRLESQGKVMGRTIDGKTLILFDGKGKAYIFTWQKGRQAIPLYGRKIENMKPEQERVTFEGDCICAEWEPGMVYVFDVNEISK